MSFLRFSAVLSNATLFLGNGRALHVTRRGNDRHVFVLLEAAARRPLNQRSYPGDRGTFRLSPSCRLVAALLKLVEGAAYAMANAGEIPAFKILGQWRIMQAELDQWLDAQARGRGDEKEHDGKA